MIEILPTSAKAEHWSLGKGIQNDRPKSGFYVSD